MNPDYEIEMYWFGLKQSMINFYKDKNINRPIKLWSENLNELQKNKQYSIIEEYIRDYISLYAIDLIKSINSYHSSILKTNIKRWNKISHKYNFNESNTTQNTIFILFLIYEDIIEKNNFDDIIINIFLEIELTILYRNYNDLIKYSVVNNKPMILKKLNTIIDIKKELKKLYNFDDKYYNYGFDKLLHYLN
jgi:hypothetical protein